MPRYILVTADFLRDAAQARDVEDIELHWDAGAVTAQAKRLDAAVVKWVQSDIYPKPSETFEALEYVTKDRAIPAKPDDYYPVLVKHCESYGLDAAYLEKTYGGRPVDHKLAAVTRDFAQKVIPEISQASEVCKIGGVYAFAYVERLPCVIFIAMEDEGNVRFDHKDQLAEAYRSDVQETKRQQKATAAWRTAMKDPVVRQALLTNAKAQWQDQFAAPLLQQFGVEADSESGQTLRQIYFTVWGAIMETLHGFSQKMGVEAFNETMANLSAAVANYAFAAAEGKAGDANAVTQAYQTFVKQNGFKQGFNIKQIADYAEPMAQKVLKQGMDQLMSTWKKENKAPVAKPAATPPPVPQQAQKPAAQPPPVPQQARASVKQATVARKTEADFSGSFLKQRKPTKKQQQAEAAVDAALVDMLLEFGAKTHPLGSSSYEYLLDTPVGELECHVRGGNLFTRFMEPERAVAVVSSSPYSGKWNHYVSKDSPEITEHDLQKIKQQFTRLMAAPKTAVAGAKTADAAFSLSPEELTALSRPAREEGKSQFAQLVRSRMQKQPNGSWTARLSLSTIEEFFVELDYMLSMGGVYFKTETEREKAQQVHSRLHNLLGLDKPVVAALLPNEPSKTNLKRPVICEDVLGDSVSQDAGFCKGLTKKSKEKKEATVTAASPEERALNFARETGALYAYYLARQGLKPSTGGQQIPNEDIAAIEDYFDRDMTVAEADAWREGFAMAAAKLFKSRPRGRRGNAQETTMKRHALQVDFDEAPLVREREIPSAMRYNQSQGPAMPKSPRGGVDLSSWLGDMSVRDFESPADIRDYFSPESLDTMFGPESWNEQEAQAARTEVMRQWRGTRGVSASTKQAQTAVAQKKRSQQVVTTNTKRAGLDFPKGWGTHAQKSPEFSCGFAISTSDEYLIEENYRSKLEEEGKEFSSFTSAEVKQINADSVRLERNALAWINENIGQATDQGHGGHEGMELIGNVWVELDGSEKSRQRVAILLQGFFDSLYEWDLPMYEGVGDNLLGHSQDVVVQFFAIEEAEAEMLETYVETGSLPSDPSAKSEGPLVAFTRTNKGAQLRSSTKRSAVRTTAREVGRKTALPRSPIPRMPGLPAYKVPRRTPVEPDLEPEAEDILPLPPAPPALPPYKKPAKGILPRPRLPQRGAVLQRKAMNVDSAIGWIKTDEPSVKEDIRRLGLRGAAKYNIDLINESISKGDKRWVAISTADLIEAFHQMGLAQGDYSPSETGHALKSQAKEQGLAGPLTLHSSRPRRAAGPLPPDDVEVRELKLFAENDQQIYRQQMAIYQNLVHKLDVGKYDPELAIKGFQYASDMAAKRYQQEFGVPGEPIFSVAVRREVARQMRDEFEQNIETGEYDLAPMKHKKHEQVDTREQLRGIRNRPRGAAVRRAREQGHYYENMPGAKYVLALGPEELELLFSLHGGQGDDIYAVASRVNGLGMSWVTEDEMATVINRLDDFLNGKYGEAEEKDLDTASSLHYELTNLQNGSGVEYPEGIIQEFDLPMPSEPGRTAASTRAEAYGLTWKALPKADPTHDQEYVLLARGGRKAGSLREWNGKYEGSLKTPRFDYSGRVDLSTATSLDEAKGMVEQAWLDRPRH